MNGGKPEKNNKRIQTIFSDDIVDGNAYCGIADDGICGAGGGNGRGSATVVIQGINSYGGTKAVKFKIMQKPVENAKKLQNV